MRDVASKIYNEWKRVGDQWYWGDQLDVRYYLVKRLQEDIRPDHQRTVEISSNVGIIINQSVSPEKIAFEFNPEAVEAGKKHFPETQFVRHSSENIPFPVDSESADVVILAGGMAGWCFSMDTYEKLKDGDQARTQIFDEIYRMLKPGGLCYITATNHEHTAFVKHRDRATFSTVTKYFKKFDVLEMRGWNPLPTALNLLPKSVVKKIPSLVHRGLSVPTVKMYSSMPYVWELLEYLSDKKFFNRKSRHMFVKLQKPQVNEPVH